VHAQLVEATGDVIGGTGVHITIDVNVGGGGHNCSAWLRTTVLLIAVPTYLGGVVDRSCHRTGILAAMKMYWNRCVIVVGATLSSTTMTMGTSVAMSRATEATTTIMTVVPTRGGHSIGSCM
jgi:hypothetical protein